MAFQLGEGAGDQYARHRYPELWGDALLEMSNLPTHPAMDVHPGFFKGKISRGFCQRRSGSSGFVTHRLHFVFNPFAVNLGYNIDENVLNEALEEDPDTPLIAATSTMSFDLLFDRHYEVWENPHENLGVMADIYVLEAMLGMNIPIRDSVTKSPVGAPTFVPLEFFFGGESSFSFVGNIVTMNAQVTHFTQKMIPTRMAVGLTVKRVQNINGKPSNYVPIPREPQYDPRSDPEVQHYYDNYHGGGGFTAS